MKQTIKGIFLAAALCASGQSICSDTSRTGWSLPYFKFPSWTMPTWPAMLSFPWLRSSSTLPTLPQEQKDTATTWTPVVVASGVTLATGTTIFAWWRYNKAKQRAKVDTKCYFRTQDLTSDPGPEFQKHDCPNSRAGMCHCSGRPLQLYSFAELQTTAQSKTRCMFFVNQEPLTSKKTATLAAGNSMYCSELGCWQNNGANCPLHGSLTAERKWKACKQP
jgi:hypothetical protein